ncbi:1-acyl-sn-glycerol-3-phosphate acyltransferase [Aliikangiella sp. IMCC44359]|uniref:1-acyl-sn-glycerol-3-phosphate acyltransferase n=1 Tax=Aliikangiella sp. IMCC44359 TaxID=3459125 RepID=UPI00403B17C9
MDAEVTIPLWLFVILITIASTVIIQKFLFPGLRWFIRKKINRAINELNQRLNIKIRPFQLTKRQVLLDRLIHDTQVLEFVQKQSVEDEVPREVLMEKVHRYAREIVPTFNAYIYYRLGYWLSKKLAKLLYRVRVRASKSDHLKNVSKDATVVFVINHRSNMDYILVSFLVAEKMALSYAVGEWARVWPLRGLVKSMGAYFVRRNSRNPLYRKVLERYIAMATKEGVCQVVFPEGGLSRNGKIREPKLGFLGYMLRSFNPQKDRDVVFIPVGLNYDRVLEDKTLLLSLDEASGKKGHWYAVKTTLKFIWNNFRLARRHQWKRFGYASVSFSQPISARDYCSNNAINFSSLEVKQRFIEVKKLSHQLMIAVEKTIPVVPVVLLCKALLSCDKNKMDIASIKQHTKQLMQKIEAQGGHIVFPHKNKDIALNAAIDMLRLRRFIECEKEVIHINSDSIDVLKYYANSIAYWC